MTGHRVHRRADAVAQPWRNGGGVAHELLREPATGPFALRISIAQIDADGPFSVFPGVDRVIGLLDGNGFRLDGPAGEVSIRAVGEIFRFRGEDPWSCVLLDGPVRDVNVMVDRSRYALGADVVRDGVADLGARGFVIAIGPVRIDAEVLGSGDVLEGAGRMDVAGRVVALRVRGR